MSSIRMLQSSVSSDEMTLIMARAFDQAWDDFTRRGVLIDPVLMRSELASSIVALAQSGENDEFRLAEGGLIHLRKVYRSIQSQTGPTETPKNKFGRGKDR